MSVVTTGPRCRFKLSIGILGVSVFISSLSLLKNKARREMLSHARARSFLRGRWCSYRSDFLKSAGNEARHATAMAVLTRECKSLRKNQGQGLHTYCLFDGSPEVYPRCFRLMVWDIYNNYPNHSEHHCDHCKREDAPQSELFPNT